LPSESLQIIEQEIRRMERCLKTFLDFARPPKLSRQATDLAQVVERSYSLLRGRAAKQHVELEFAPPAGKVMADVDADQIHQLLVNLSLNALDAMPAGGRLRVELDNPQNGQVELRVLDSGPGISPQVMPRLFEPFASDKETGLGLGLVVSRRIAEEHGGSLTVQNQPQGGAAFTLRLPAG
jgi:two-component system sensor histidine kinase HydH